MRIIEPCCPVQVVDMTLTVFTTCPVLLQKINDDDDDDDSQRCAKTGSVEYR